MRKIMLSCKRATELIEKRAVGTLGFVEALQLRLHTMMCQACSAYEKQSKTIDKVIAKWTEKPTETKKESLSEDFKSNIINKIKDLE